LKPAILIENLSKQYRLGSIGTGTLTHDFKRWMAKIRGKEDPGLKIGMENKLAEEGGEYVWALQDINLEVQQGDILGIIGKNGAGKSTLLKILSRVTSPTTGNIVMQGRVASLLEVGTGFHGELTGRENIFLNGAIMGMTKTEIKLHFDEIVEFSGVGKYIDTPVKRYSSGMYVRLAFAVAAHLEAEILIVDEVLAVGDIDFQKKSLSKMNEIAKAGRTVLFVSHNTASVRGLCNKAIALSMGKIWINKDEPEIVINKYIKENISSTIGSNLSIRKDRLGIGRVRFTDLQFISKSGNQIADVVFGEETSFQIWFHVFNDTKILDVGISVWSLEGINKFAIWSNYTNDYLYNLKGGNTYIVKFQIPKFPLAPGTYYINLVAKSDNELCDKVQNARVLNVNEGDYFGNGKSLSDNLKGMFFDYSWTEKELKSNNEKTN
jgi:lipopolysaccharide transport system ATP-binding protein